MSERGEDFLERIRIWAQDYTAAIRETLLALVNRSCGLTILQADPVVWSTLEEFSRRAGFCGPSLDDFEMLLLIFRRNLVSRFPDTNPDLLQALRELPPQRAMIEAIRKFPGGMWANLPDVKPDDWMNAVLATLPGRGGDEPGSPWVHPPAEGGGDPDLSPGRTSFSVADLVTLLFDTSPVTRREAVGALARLGPEAKEAIPALQVALEDRDPEIRQAVRAALRAIDVEP